VLSKDQYFSSLNGIRFVNYSRWKMSRIFNQENARDKLFLQVYHSIDCTDSSPESGFGS
jgi:hypothetical protein